MRLRPDILRLVLAILALTGGALSVRADPLETYGLTSRVRALGGAAAATSAAGAAVLYNPAALTAAKGPTLGLGALAVMNRLEPVGANGTDEPAFGYEVTLASPIPLGPAWQRRVYLGLALLLPHAHLYDYDVVAVEAPAWVGIGSSSRRLVLGASLGVRVVEQLSVGIGLSLLPVVTGRVDLDLTDSEGSNTTLVDVDPRFRPVAGILYEPVPGWRIGLAYRMGNYANIDLPVHVDASGIELDARVSGPMDWTPSVLSLGAELPVWKDHLTIAVQADWRMTGGYQHISSDVALYDGSGEDGLGAEVPDAGFRDSVAARLGMEWTLNRYSARCGYAFVSRSAPEQSGRSNLLDAHRHQISLGAAADVLQRSGDTPRLTFSLDAQVLALHETLTEKTVYAPENPGFPTLRSGGQVWVVGAGMEVGW